jgi:hypothetical protein
MVKPNNQSKHSINEFNKVSLSKPGTCTDGGRAERNTSSKTSAFEHV